MDEWPSDRCSICGDRTPGVEIEECEHCGGCESCCSGDCEEYD